MVIRETAVGVDDQVEPVQELGEQEEEKKVKKSMRKGKILESLKNTLSDIFDETDVKM